MIVASGVAAKADAGAAQAGSPRASNWRYRRTERREASRGEPAPTVEQEHRGVNPLPATCVRFIPGWANPAHASPREVSTATRLFNGSPVTYDCSGVHLHILPFLTKS